MAQSQTLKKAKAADRRTTNKTYRTVGEFFYHWNIFEGELSRYVTQICRLGPLESAIICANLNFQSKMGILYSSVDLYLGVKKPEREMFNRIFDINTDWRNVVAHTAFGVEGDAIKFLRIQAKRELKFPPTIRSHKEFKAVFAELEKLSEEVEKLVKKSIRVRDAYDAHKNTDRAPTLNLNALGSVYAPSNPPRGLLDLIGTNHGTSAQTPLVLQEAEEASKKK